LISLYVSEKKATSDPDKTKERNSNTNNTITSTVVPCASMADNKTGLEKTAKPGDDPKQEFLMKDQDERGFAFPGILFGKSIVFVAVLYDQNGNVSPGSVNGGISSPGYPSSESPAMATMCIAAFIKHDQVITHYFCSKFFIAFFVFPAAGTQTAFYINKAAFMKIFLRQLCQALSTIPLCAILFARSVCRNGPYRFPWLPKEILLPRYFLPGAVHPDPFPNCR
jgi:hypothetical protein